MTLPYQVQNLLEDYEANPAICNCLAHVSFRYIFYTECLGRLILLPCILTDHYGNELAESLLPFIIQKCESNVIVRKCGLGSPYSVNFVLQLPSGRAYHFTGRPDFMAHILGQWHASL